MKITVQDLKSQINSGRQIQLVDVRARTEFSSGHIPTSVNIPMDEIESRIPDLHSAGPVVLVCRSDRRANMTCELIAKQHPELFVLEGGTQAWEEAGLEMIRTSKTRWSIERQVRLTVGALVLTGLMLSLIVSKWWLILPAFLACGLTFAGITDFCGMAALYAKMPWNRPPRSQALKQISPAQQS